MELGRNCHSENELEIEIERHSDTSLRAGAVSSSNDVLAEATTSNDGIRRLLKTTAEKLGWDVGALWMMDFATRRLHLLHGWASRSAGAESFLASSRTFSFAPGEGFPGKVFETGRAHWLRDAGTDGRYWRSDLAARHGIKSVILFPVTSKSHTFGVLEFCAHHSTSMDEEQMRSMAVTGSHLGEFLERCHATDRFSEVTRRNVMVQALVQVERNNLRALFAQAPAAIAVLRGPDLRYELSNPFHRQLAGGREVVGKKLREAFPDHGALDMVSLIEQAYERGEPVVLEELRLTLAEAPDGHARTAFMSGVMQPLVGATGQVDGVVVFAQEVTELVSARARVEGAEERLRLALDASNVGIWEYYPTSGALFCDAKCKALFGLPPDATPTATEFLKAIHPDDRAQVASSQRRALEASSGGDYACEYRTSGPTDGQERWVSARGRTFFDADGRPERVLGTGIDITSERRALERAAFLARAGTLLASSLDYRRTLAQVVELAVPRLADCCTIELVNERGEVESLELAHSDQEKAELVRSLSSEPPGAARSLFAHVVRTAEPAYIPNMTEELLVKLAGDERQVRILREIGPRSAILMPLLGRERPIGVIGLSYGGSGRRYTEEDLDFAEELARRAALAIENAMLYRAAQTAIRHRDDFLSVASHELKTPVTTLMLQTEGFLGDLQHGSLGTDELKSRLEGSLEQIHRLSSLLDDLLDVSRVASGHLRIARTTMDLSELALEVISRFRESARRVGCRIDMKLEGRAVGRWDRDRLEQVLTNLLSNAIKFAPGKPVEVLIQNRGDHMQIGVRDQGPGIAPADRQNVFDRFERATSASGVGGLGLGLWIAREIVRAHGGDIVVEGEHGRGADFRVALPL